MITTFTAISAVLLCFVYAALQKGSPLREFALAGRQASPLGVGSGLYTLVGGGEIATLVALGGMFGFSAILLFAGYAAGFVLLGCFVSVMRANAEPANLISLPDYLENKYGRFVGDFALVISLAAFVALLVLQFVVGGSLLASLTGLDFWLVGMVISLVVAIYLSLHGFQAVLRTDILQGVALVALGLTAILFLAGHKQGVDGTAEFAAMPKLLAFTLGYCGCCVRFPRWLYGHRLFSLFFTGFFVALSSSDVWQRVFSADSDRSARLGLFGGGAALLLLGTIFTSLGIIANASGLDVADPGTALLQLFRDSQAGNAIIAALLVMAVLSTADTETYLISSLICRRLSLDLSRQNIVPLIFLVSVLAWALASIFRDAVGVYTWLLLLLLTLSPMVIWSLVSRKALRLPAIASLVVSFAVFILLAVFGILNFDNAFMIVGLGGVALMVTYPFAMSRD